MKASKLVKISKKVVKKTSRKAVPKVDRRGLKNEAKSVVKKEPKAAKVAVKKPKVYSSNPKLQALLEKYIAA